MVTLRKTKFLHEARSLFRSNSFDLWSRTFLSSCSLGKNRARRRVLHRFRFRENCIPHLRRYYCMHLHFCCDLPNCNYVYISLQKNTDAEEYSKIKFVRRNTPHILRGLTLIFLRSSRLFRNPIIFQNFAVPFN